MAKRITESAVVIAAKSNEQLCEDLAALDRLRAHIVKELKDRCKEQGPISYAGVSVDNRQTVSEPLPMPGAIMEALAMPDKWQPGTKDAVLLAALEAISSRSWKKFVFGIPEQTLLQSALAEMEDGGMQIIYGSARLDVRKTPPDPAKTHVLLPGDKPLVNTNYTPPEDEDDEYEGGNEEYGDFDSLSPGD